MSLDSSSSSSSGDDSTDLNPNSDPKLVDESFNLLTLTEPVELEPNHLGSGDGIANRSLNREGINNSDAEDDRLRVENQEIFGDEGPSSPSSSGYAGERGSSSATSASRIDGVSEIDDSDIQVVRNDGSLDGISNSQASSWVPGKRHVDEVSHFIFSLVNIEKNFWFSLFLSEFNNHCRTCF